MTTALVPVSIITGALGSGKTTLLNYLLTEHHGMKIGVIVNEFGDVGIDSKLIVHETEEMIELANGCVCCTVRGDLVRAVNQILTTTIEYLLVETSGMAEPGPVANTFLAGEPRLHCKLDGIITVVDAENLPLALKFGADTTRSQIKAADVVLLNKTDLVTPVELVNIETTILDISPRTYVFKTVRCRAPLEILLATGKFDIDGWVAQGKDRDSHHEHAAGFDAVALHQSSPLRIDEANRFARSLPPEIFRGKGVLCVANMAEPNNPEKDLRMVFHKVGARIETFFDRPWRKDESHETTIVLIVQGIERAQWQNMLDACVSRG
jgi:G3E family GTPase